MNNEKDSISEAIEKQRRKLEQNLALLSSLKIQRDWIEKRIEEIEREVALLENFGD